MPQTAQEKAIHAKSNGSSNEVTFASLLDDDSTNPKSHPTETTENIKKSYRLRDIGNYAMKKVHEKKQQHQDKQEQNRKHVDEFMDLFSKIRNDDSLDTKQRLEKLDRLMDEYYNHNRDKFKPTANEQKQIFGYKAKLEQKARDEKITTTQELNQEKEIKQKQEERKQNEEQRPPNVFRPNFRSDRPNPEKKEMPELEKKEVSDERPIKLAMLSVGLNPDVKSDE